MRYYKSDIELLKEYQSDIQNLNATAEQIRLVQSLYRSIFSKELNQSCSSCWHDAVIDILIYDKNNMDNQNFHLKIGATLIDMANSEMNCCHRDMTDEKAIYHLNFAIAYDKANPNPYKPMLNTTLEKFSNMPENWKDLLSGIPQKNDHLTIPSIKELLRAKAYVDKDFTFKSKEALLEMLSKP